ncbi:MGMT family protein [Amycolatopsis jejuensis]|uniref:MGMT family protein n=1 Tax=Amycolatopsis jejuensis TaxID=330084 RepID=UPI0006893D70|nr:MGMT family protein [Amycolatopsis jejuensis]
MTAWRHRVDNTDWTTVAAELDQSLSHSFRRLVQRHLPENEYGATRNYSQVSELVGNRTADRAVGTAPATNPQPVVVPCQAKTTLLQLEAA